MPIRVLCIILCLPLLAGGGELTSYETPHYTIYSDLDNDGVREAELRMTKMAEEYAYRTRGFSRAMRQKMPFYLYGDAEAFHATGAPEGVAGYFDGSALVALARDMGPQTWHTVQHEGFHQFARLVITPNLPVWVNEGLAEYFGEAIFTGDGFVAGVIPPWRLKRVKETLAAERFRLLVDMMTLSHQQWNSELAIINYDQGWTMVHFLAHADNGKYQKAFGAFIDQLGSGASQEKAWRATFGDVRGLEERWRAYWSKLPDDPTAQLYAQANVATLTSFLARAAAQRQAFDSFDAFKQAAAAKQLQAHPDDWLPPSLLSSALWEYERISKQGARYAIEPLAGERWPQLVCRMPDGTRIVGRFVVRNGRAVSVEAKVFRD